MKRSVVAAVVAMMMIAGSVAPGGAAPRGVVFQDHSTRAIQKHPAIPGGLVSSSYDRDVSVSKSFLV